MKALYKNFFRKKDSSNPVLQALGNIPIFENLRDSELNDVARLTHEGTYKLDEHVFKKLAPAEGMYVIMNGAVEINDPDSGTIFASLESGDFFGEIALLKDAPRTADVSAKSFSDLLILERSDFDKFLDANPEIKQTIEKVAESRLRT